MEDILYKVTTDDFFVLDGKGGRRREFTHEASGLDGFRRVELGMEGARDLMHVLMAENIVGHDGRAEDQDEREQVYLFQ